MIPVLKLNGEEIGAVNSMEEVGRWMSDIIPANGNIRIRQSDRLPVMNNGNDRKFKRIAVGRFVGGRPVPAVLAEFLSKNKRTCYVIAPHDLITPV